jgi:hypothetical protein
VAHYWELPTFFGSKRHPIALSDEGGPFIFVQAFSAQTAFPFRDFRTSRHPAIIPDAANYLPLQGSQVLTGGQVPVSLIGGHGAGHAGTHSSRTIGRGSQMVFSL